jgi:hypothetical protein
LNPLRSIIATLLAFLIASPLCCCTAKAEVQAPKSCCVEKGSKPVKKDKEPCACACKVKEPREKAKDLELPCNVAVPFVPVVQDLSWLAAPVVVHVPMAGTPHTGCDPPRLLLARYSRWLN